MIISGPSVAPPASQTYASHRKGPYSNVNARIFKLLDTVFFQRLLFIFFAFFNFVVNLLGTVFELVYENEAE